MSGHTPERLWQDIQAHLQRRDQELREWQAQQDQRSAVHIEQVSRSLAANHLVISASVDRLTSRMDRSDAADSEDDIHRYETGAGISQTLLQLLSVNLRVEAHMDSERTIMGEVLALQHQIYTAAQRTALIEQMAPIHQQTLELAQRNMLGIQVTHDQQRVILETLQLLARNDHRHAYIQVITFLLVVFGVALVIVVLATTRGVGVGWLRGVIQ